MSAYTDDQIRQFIAEQGIADNPYAIYNYAKQYGVSSGDIDRVLGATPGQSDAWIASQGLKGVDGSAYGGTAVSNPDVTPQQIKQYIDTMGIADNPHAIKAFADQYGVSPAEVDTALGARPGQSAEWLQYAGYNPSANTAPAGGITTARPDGLTLAPNPTGGYNTYTPPPGGTGGTGGITTLPGGTGGTRTGTGGTGIGTQGGTGTNGGTGGITGAGGLNVNGTNPVTAGGTPILSDIDASQSTLSPNFAPYVYNMLAKGEAAANMPYQEYTGQRFAGPSELQQQAFGGIRDLQVPGEFDEAAGIASLAAQRATTDGKYNAPDPYNPTEFSTGLQGMKGSGFNLDTIRKFATEQGLAGPDGIVAPSEQNYQQLYNYAKQYGVPPEQLDKAFGWEPGQSAQYVTDQGMGEYWKPEIGGVEEYMNPYTQNVTDIQAREARRQAEIGRVAEQARLAQAGAYGGSRQAIMEAERQRNLNTQIGDITEKGLQSAYDRAQTQRMDEARLGMDADKNTEQSRQFGYSAEMEGADKSARYGLDGLAAQLNASKTLSDIGTSKFTTQKQGLDMQLNAGQVQNDLAQKPLDFSYSQFQDSMKYPYQQATYMSSLLQGLPLAANKYDSGTSAFASGLQGGLYGLMLGGGQVPGTPAANTTTAKVA